MSAGDWMPVPPAPLENDQAPGLGERVVFIYPPEWGLDNRYGTVHKLNPDGTYYIIDAKNEQWVLIDPRRNIEHGAVVRRLVGKEKFPTGRKKKKVSKKG
jgi:hypothetical protein